MSTAKTPAAAPAKKENFIDVFFAGARKGLGIGFNTIMPAMVMGYVLVQALKVSGIMDVLATVFAPVMGLFGLPGEAFAVLISAFFAKAAGAAAAANLYTAGVITAPQATILLMPCMLMGTLIGHYARIVLVSEANPKLTPIFFAIPLIDSAVGMIIVRIILTAMGLM